MTQSHLTPREMLCAALARLVLRRVHRSEADGVPEKRRQLPAHHAVRPAVATMFPPAAPQKLSPGVYGAHDAPGEPAQNPFGIFRANGREREPVRGSWSLAYKHIRRKRAFMGEAWDRWAGLDATDRGK